jgi:LacI family transcriptional regulator
VIGLIVHDISDPFFNIIARGAEDFAGEHGKLVVVCNSDRRPHKLVRYLERLRDFRVDAVILAGGELQAPGHREEREKYLEQMERNGVAVVTIGRYARPGSSLVLDNAGGIRTLVDHLVGLGHRRIAHIAGVPGSSATIERLRAYEAALEAHGLPVDPSLVCDGDFGRQSGAHAAEAFMSAPHPPTAIIAANDEMAAGCIRALRRRGVRVPEDVSVVGFNDVPTAADCEPPLTTIRLPLRHVGARAVQMALEVRSGDQVASEEVAGELVVRQSTGPASRPPRRAAAESRLEGRP